MISMNHINIELQLGVDLTWMLDTKVRDRNVIIVFVVILGSAIMDCASLRISQWTIQVSRLETICWYF